MQAGAPGSFRSGHDPRRFEAGGEAVPYERVVATVPNDVFEQLLDHVRQGIAVFDKETHLICWNRQFGEVLQLPNEMVRIGIDLAGKVVETVTGQSIEAYFRLHIFEPLGMRDTALGDAIQVVQAAGFDLIVVETAGIGQSDSEIVDLVDFDLPLLDEPVDDRALRKELEDDAATLIKDAETIEAAVATTEASIAIRLTINVLFSPCGRMGPGR